jgi:hypothetical protein
MVIHMLAKIGAKRIKISVGHNKINDTSYVSVKELDISENGSAIAYMFSFNPWRLRPWDHVQKIYNSFLTRQGYHYNEAGIIFPEEAEEWENQEGVLLHIPDCRIELSLEAFDLLANRYFHAVYQLAVENGDRQLTTAWGKEFVEYVKSHPTE